jgi:hypothetical protein
VLVKPKILKSVCKGGTSITTPVAGVLEVTLTAGLDHNYCAEYGGTVIKNNPTIFKAKEAPPPGGCNSPSGAFLETAAPF